MQVSISQLAEAKRQENSVPLSATQCGATQTMDFIILNCSKKLWKIMESMAEPPVELQIPLAPNRSQWHLQHLQSPEMHKRGHRSVADVSAPGAWCCERRGTGNSTGWKARWLQGPLSCTWLTSYSHIVHYVFHSLHSYSPNGFTFQNRFPTNSWTK